MIKTMLRQYRRTVTICSLLILMPGLIAWIGNTFPGLPWFMPVLSLFYFLLFWIVIPLTFRDPKQKDQNPKVINLELWTFPAISWLTFLINDFVSADQTDLLLPAVEIGLGLLFILFGNYLPKSRPNSTFGIRIPWTYASAENWRRTNRLGGQMFVIGGFLLLLGACWSSAFYWLFPLIVLLLVVIPLVYSYRLYREEVREGKAAPITGKQMRSFRIAITTIVLIFVFAGFSMFLGKVDYRIESNEVVLSATLAGSTTIPYDEIESIQMEKNFDPGYRVFGIGNLKIYGGTFRNNENGVYTLYGEAGANQAIVLKTPDGEVILSLKDDQLLDQIYQELRAKIESDK